MPEIKKSLSKKYLEGPLNSKGNKEKNKKESANGGIISSLLANIITFALSGHMKQIDSLIDPQKRKDVAIAARNVKVQVAKYNKHLNNPEIKSAIEAAGKTVEDFYMDDISISAAKIEHDNLIAIDNKKSVDIKNKKKKVSSELEDLKKKMPLINGIEPHIHIQVHNAQKLTPKNQLKVDDSPNFLEHTILFLQAAKLCVVTQYCSVKFLCEELKIKPNVATLIIQKLEDFGIITLSFDKKNYSLLISDYDELGMILYSINLNEIFSDIFNECYFQ